MQGKTNNISARDAGRANNISARDTGNIYFSMKDHGELVDFVNYARWHLFGYFGVIIDLLIAAALWYKALVNMTAQNDLLVLLLCAVKNTSKQDCSK